MHYKSLLSLLFCALLFIGISASAAQTITACPVPDENPMLDTSTEFFDFGQEIEVFLSAGGSLDSLIDIMQSRLISGTGSAFARRGGGQTLIEAWAADVDGDSVEDVVVNLRGGDDDTIRAAIWLYLCDGEAYNLATTVTHEGSRFFREALVVTHVQDLTDDGFAELVHHATLCAPRFCETLLRVEQWDNEALEWTPLAFNTTVYHLSYSVEDADEDGYYEIVRYDGLYIDNRNALSPLPDVTYEWDGEQFVEQESD